MKRISAWSSLLLAIGIVATLFAQTSEPQAKLLTTIDTGKDLAILAAWAPRSERLAYGTETRIKRRGGLGAGDDPYAYPGEVWVLELGEEPDRILKHDFLRRRRGDFFSFSVERLAWSPNGKRLLVELTDEDDNTATFFLTDGGKKVEMGDSGQNFASGYGGAWLGDNESVILLVEAVAPRLLHQLKLVRVEAGRQVQLFPQKTFAAVAALSRAEKVVGIERDLEFRRPPRLGLGDVQSGKWEIVEENATTYIGGLQVRWDEKLISYFVSQDKLAVRAPKPDSPVELWPVSFGRYAWAGSRRAVLFIEPEKLGERSGWLTLYDREREATLRVLPQEKIQDFWVSPDGTKVAVLTTGLMPRMKIYRLPAP